MNRSILLFICLFQAINTKAYVENVSKGYPNCIACHVSISGGGILTDYGRSVSRELSTIKGPKGFENPFFGLVHNKKNIKFGGHFRTIKFHSENDQVKVGRSFTMQNNVEVAFDYQNIFAVGTLGRQEGPDGASRKGEFLSERHFLGLKPSELSQIRVGLFRQQFGINDPNHTRFVKANLGFGSYSETYNLDFTQIYNWGEINVSHSLGDFFDDNNFQRSERNFVFNLTHYGSGSSRLGVSYLKGKNSTVSREILGLHGVYGLGKKGVARSEVDILRTSSIGEVENQYGVLGSHLVGYNFFTGGLGYLVLEHKQDDMGDSDSFTYSPGVGFQLLPLPHFEIQGEAQRRINIRDRDNPENRLFLTLHVYH